ncbi:hypothetical protein [Cardinium endosymbiont of Philonthus spinipes]|uniref:hypothetical protein n=1 Tax=Cardinium endosymbiont of Philonthus spinipes TaxID=3077941 RepID=UPI00313E0B17
MCRDFYLQENTTVGINLIGLANGQAIVIPIQLCGKTNQSNANDSGVGAIGKALVKELPYIKAIVSRLFPEILFLLKNVHFQLSADLDNQYDCEIIDTVSAQLPLALLICMLLRKALGLPVIENCAATGTLDPLGFITHVQNLFLKKLAAKNSLLIEPSSFYHIFHALKAIHCLVIR